MASKFNLFVYAILLVKAISCQYNVGQFGPGPYNPGYYGPGRFDAPYAPCNGIASTGGGFPVRSVSPIAPTGLSVVSENLIEGKLGAGGQLPFLGTVALEGTFPTAGVAAISYACGNGAVGITSEGPIATGILNQGPYGQVGALGPVGYAPLGCGCAL